MRKLVPSRSPQAAAVVAVAACVAIVASGCSRTKYRLQADHDAYDVIAERNYDARWHTPDYDIEIDPRSRYFDAYNPDHSPMPLDDPASHSYMHFVDGKKGWKHWHDNGERVELENPAWQEALAEYVQLDTNGAVMLDLASAVRLSYVHSPTHQSQLETMYLSALDVTAERFRLDTQYFGGYDAVYNHNGSLVPAALSYNTVAQRFEVTPPADVDGRELNRITAGRPTSGNPALLARRRFATAGELLAGFANSFVFELTGGDANLSASLAHFSFIQPLLRGAGKDVALEQLTFAERRLLANLRAYGQFRQGFYTQVAIGELGVTGPQRGGAGTNLQSFSGSGFVGGYLGLLQQLQQIRNDQDNLRLQERTLAQLRAFLAVDVINPLQVEEFYQSVESARANLLRRRVTFELALDRYKTDTLGLPPDLQIQLDESLIRQFELVPREAASIHDSMITLRLALEGQPNAPVEVLDQVSSSASPLIEPVRQLLDAARQDVARMDEIMPRREPTMSEEDKRVFQVERTALLESLADRERDLQDYVIELERIRAAISDTTRGQARKDLLVWIRKTLRLVERTVLLQARARLEMVTVPVIELDSQAAFNIALTNRLDFMNGRASLVDSWRLIQFNADALQSVVDVTGAGDVRTARNNPVSFRAPTGTLRLGLEVDAPFTRLLERNAYRESLIQYQRNRRNFIQSRDGLHLGLRALLRTIDQLRADLEIQRRSVAIAIRRVDLTQARLAAPPPGRRPGQPAAQFTPTTTRDLLGAQRSLRDTQNALLRVWLDYYAARMRLARELGIMALDPDGQWIEYPLPSSSEDVPNGFESNGEELPVPPLVPAGWVDLANYIEPPNARGAVRPAGHFTPTGPRTTHVGYPLKLHRLPPTQPYDAYQRR